MSSVRIVSDGTSANSRVEVDGVPLDCVTRVTFDLGVNEPATATITVVLPELDLTLEDWVITKPTAATDPQELTEERL